MATGALAFVVFLGSFVKYAWENNWIGPAGRVLSGAVFGLGFVAFGTRLMRRELRPLGQGLAGMGLAALYLSAFASHGVYDLVPRSAAGVLMACVTVSAVALAARLDARLLASLAWVGAYLTPVLLSTGEDRAIALYIYLALIDIGALVLDHKRPWPETVPLAMLGTLVLYAGWYVQFFRPERFEVAAFGIVLFSALFALGAARKERSAVLVVTYGAAALGLSVLAASADRPEWLLLMSLALGGAVLFTARRLNPTVALVAPVALGLPFVAWALAHDFRLSFPLAVAWVVGALLLLVLTRTGERALDAGFPAVAITGAGLASIVMSAQVDRPAALMVFLCAQAGVAILAHSRWRWSETAGVLAGALSTGAWFASFFDGSRGGDAYLVAFPAAGLYLVALTVRGFRERLGVPGVLAHMTLATWAWWSLYAIFGETNPSLLGWLSVGLAALYLAVGLASKREVAGDALQLRTWLGIAAVFLTIAIPVQLGLHGITLAWAVEGVVLLGLGRRFESLLTRVGAYAVLALTVLRLLARHTPLHPDPHADFLAFLNPSFGIWLAAVLALGAAVYVLRDVREWVLDSVARIGLASTALVILFGVLTSETWDAVIHVLTYGALTGDMSAKRWAGVAISALWTLYATALLATGLALRNRALFYASYGLFAFTAFKVVLVDLATFPTLFRMFSFLALALLLLAGAYLNLRFRERLLPGNGRKAEGDPQKENP